MNNESAKNFLNKPMVESTLGDQMIMHATSVVMTIMISLVMAKVFVKK